MLSVSITMSDQCYVFEILILVRMWSQMKPVCIQYMRNFTYNEAAFKNRIMHILNFIDCDFILYPTMLTDLLESFYRSIAQFMKQFKKVVNKKIIQFFLNAD